MSLHKVLGRIPYKIIVLILLIVFTILYTIPWTLENSTEKAYSGVDFHGYWYAGHYTRAGINPYWAIFNKEAFPPYWDPRYPGSGVPYQNDNKAESIESELKLPIHYLDGYVVTEHPVAQMLTVAPAATAPLTLFMGLFSWFSWPVARFAWLVLNILLALLIPWLGFRLIENYKNIELLDKLIIAFIFYNLYGVRQCLVVGQQSIVSLFLLMVALLFKDRWLIAGILLGIGISKYSVGLPIFLLFLLNRNVRVIIVSLITQFVGMLLMAPLSHGSLFETIKAYLKALELNYSQDGIHLLARFPNNYLIGYILIAGMLIFLVYLLRDFYYKFGKQFNNILQLNTLNLLIIGIFLAVYHRVHDLSFAIFFFMTIMAFREVFRLYKHSMTYNSIVTIQVLLTIILIFPSSVDAILNFMRVDAASSFSVEAMSTIAMILMLGVSAWIQIKTLSSLQKDALKVGS